MCRQPVPLPFTIHASKCSQRLYANVYDFMARTISLERPTCTQTQPRFQSYRFDCYWLRILMATPHQQTIYRLYTHARFVQNAHFRHTHTHTTITTELRPIDNVKIYGQAF